MTSLQLVHSEELFGDMKQGFFACDKIKNVTIVPFMRNKNDIYGMIGKLTYLVKSLLDTPCTTVWVYSPLEIRSIVQNKDNFNNFLETKIQAINTPIDTNILIDLVTEVKKLAGEENEQTLLMINDWAMGLPEKTICTNFRQFKGDGVDGIC